jgi:hypothetical protein
MIDQRQYALTISVGDDRLCHEMDRVSIATISQLGRTRVAKDVAEKGRRSLRQVTLSLQPGDWREEKRAASLFRG